MCSSSKLGFVPGNRVLLRSANNPMMVATYLAVLKAGGVVVATMPLLRAKEIAYPVAKAKISLALCDHRLADEMERARSLAPDLRPRRVLGIRRAGQPRGADGRRPRRISTAVDTAADDVCLIGFTSGTTGEPKGTMHFHRDLLAICDGYGRNVLRAGAGAIASSARRRSPLRSGSAGSCCFRMRIGASTVLLEKAGPDDLLPAIAQHQGTICFTAPTAYRAMLPKLDEHDSRPCANASRPASRLPKATFEAWQAATGHQADGRHRRHRDAPYLHRRARGRDPPRRDGQARSGLRGEGRRR